MPGPAHCDQCGRELSEEDFRTGGAFRDRADVLCAECYAMYQEDERRREREKKRRDSAAAIGARTAVRGRPPSSRRTEAGPLKGAPRRGTTRVMAAARRSGRGGARREPQSKSWPVGVFVLAAAVAFAAALGIRYFMMKKAPATQDPVPQAPVLQAPETPDVPGQEAPASAPPAPAAAPKEAEKEPERDGRSFGKSLFGPGGHLERREKR